MLTNPRTVCFCHPVTCIISASVTPFARFIMAMTSAFLLLRSEALPGFFGAAVFFPGLACLAGLPFLAGFALFRTALGFAVSCLALPVSAAIGSAALVLCLSLLTWFIVFSLPRRSR